MKQIYIKFSMLLLCMVVGMSAWATNYKLVTSADELKAGKNYIIANGTSGSVYVVSTEISANNRRTTTATSSKGIIESSDAMLVFTLGGEKDAWTFMTTNYLAKDDEGNPINGFLYNNNTSANRLFIGDNTTTNKFTITFQDNAISSITCNGNTARGAMYFNGNLLACYASKSTSYNVPQLYVEDNSVVINPYTVTFSAGIGSCSTTSITETKGNEGVTLPSCTTGSDDIAFIGWSTSEDGTTADAGAAGATYHPTENCTLYAVYKQYYSVTIVTPEGGTLSVKYGEDEIESGNKRLPKDNIVISATPAEGYILKNIVVNDGTDHIFTANPKTWTMGEKSITISAEFSIPKDVNITWSVDGAKTTTTVKEGSSIEFVSPTSVTEGYVFMGWSATKLAGKQSAAPTYVKSATAKNDITYYAVLAKQSGSATSTLTKVESTTLEAGTYALISFDNAYYVPNDQATNKCPATKEVVSKDGVISVTDDMKWTVSGDNEKGYVFTSFVESKVKLWGGSANDGTRVADKSGKAAATDLWYIKQVNNYGYVVYNKATTDHRYLTTYGEKDWRNYTSSSSTNRAANVYKVGGGYSYSDFCTSTVDAAVLTISAAEYATYYDSKNAYVMPDDCEGYVFTVADGLEAAYEGGDVVPAGEPLVIYTIEPGDKELVFTTTTEKTYKSGDMNDLEGTDEETALEEDATSYFYALSLDKDGKNVGFYWMNATGAAFTNGAHKAYLKAAKSATEARGFAFNGATAIKAITTSSNDKIYDLTGREVKSAKTGLYIVNGVKKYIK